MIKPPSRLENAAFVTMLAFAASTQFSIAAAQILLTLASALTIALVIRDHERIEVPRMFWPLAAYAAVTLISAVFSIAPDNISLWDSKQLLLFVIVPLAYRLFRGRRSLTAVDVVITIGALHAAYGVIQYGILNYDNLGRRVQGFLGLYMTYSGVIMLVTCTVVARLIFRKHWPAVLDEGLQARRPVAGRGGAVYRAGPDAAQQPAVLDVQPVRSVEPRSRGDDAVRRAHDL
jgi:hypothetical protein